MEFSDQIKEALVNMLPAVKEASMDDSGASNHLAVIESLDE